MQEAIPSWSCSTANGRWTVSSDYNKTVHRRTLTNLSVPFFYEWNGLFRQYNGKERNFSYILYTYSGLVFVLFHPLYIISPKQAVRKFSPHWCMQMFYFLYHLSCSSISLSNVPFQSLFTGNVLFHLYNGVRR